MEHNALQTLRQELDKIDDALVALFVRRMDAVQNIAAYKQENGISVLDEDRERQVLARAKEKAGGYQAEAEQLMQLMMKLSRDAQKRYNQCSTD